MIASWTTPVDRAAHEDRLVGQQVDLQLGRQRRLAPAATAALMLVDDVERRGVARLQDREQRRRAGRRRARCWSAARSRRARWRRRGCRSSVAADHLDRQVVQLGDRARGCVEVDVVLERRRSWRCPTGRIRFCALMALTTSARREALGLQRARVEVDHDLPLLAAVRERDGRALDGRRAAVRMKLTPSRRAAARPARCPDSASWRIGTLEAL